MICFRVFVSLQKKLPLTTLAQCMVEGAAVLGDESLLGWEITHMIFCFPTCYCYFYWKLRKTVWSLRFNVRVDVDVKPWDVCLYLCCFLTQWVNVVAESSSENHRLSVWRMFSVSVFSVCSLRILSAVFLLQEDAEAVRRDAGETGSGAHPVRAHHRERRGGAAVRPRRGTKPLCSHFWWYLTESKAARKKHRC